MDAERKTYHMGQLQNKVNVLCESNKSLVAIREVFERLLQEGLVH
jgi:hypothetical protein